MIKRPMLRLLLATGIAVAGGCAARQLPATTQASVESRAPWPAPATAPTTAGSDPVVASQPSPFDPYALSIIPRPPPPFDPVLLLPTTQPMTQPTMTAGAQRGTMPPDMSAARVVASPKDVAVLIDVLGDFRSSTDAKLLAIDALAELGPDAADSVSVLALVCRDDPATLARRARIAIRAIGPSAIGPLLEALGNEMPPERFEELSAIAQAYPKELDLRLSDLNGLVKTSPWPRERQTALRKIAAAGMFASNESIETVLHCLVDEDPAVRTAALRSAGYVVVGADHDAYFETTRLLSDEPLMRQAALDRLAKGGMKVDHFLLPVLTNVLVNILSERESAVRLEAVSAMMHIGARPEEVFPAVVVSFRKLEEARKSGAPAATNGRQSDGEAMLRSLSAFGPKAAGGAPALVKLLGQDAETDTLVGQVLSSFGPAVSSALIVALGGTDPAVRKSAATILADLYPCPPRAVDSLAVAMLGAEDPTVRTAAARALGRCAPKAVAARAGLVAAMKDDDLQVRRAALNSLAVIGPPDPAQGPKLDVRDLLAHVDSDAAESRIDAAGLLGTLGPAAVEAIPSLTRMAGNALAPARRAAADALVQIDPTGEKLGPALIAAVRQGDEPAAGTIAGSVKLSSRAGAINEKLKQITADDLEADVRRAAKRTLEIMSPAAPATMPS